MALKQQLWKSSHCKIMYKISPPSENELLSELGVDFPAFSGYTDDADRC